MHICIAYETLFLLHRWIFLNIMSGQSNPFFFYLFFEVQLKINLQYFLLCHFGSPSSTSSNNFKRSMLLHTVVLFYIPHIIILVQWSLLHIFDASSAQFSSQSVFTSIWTFWFLYFLLTSCPLHSGLIFHWHVILFFTHECHKICHLLRETFCYQEG